MDDTKECIVCGVTYERAPGSVDAVWVHRTCCSKACGSRLPRLNRYPDLPETKACQMCGTEYARPASYHGQQWALRKYCSQACNGRARSAAAQATWPAHTCPICKTEFRRAPAETALGLITCGSNHCKRAYRTTIKAAKIAALRREEYASGTRKPGKGRSHRERDVWPYLRESGWLWNLRWTDAEYVHELDFALLDRKLNVEIDGIEHREPRGVRKDTHRDALLTAQGWRILRIPNEDVDADPAAVAARILAFAE